MPDPKDRPPAHQPHEPHERPSYDPFPLWEVAVAVAAVILVVGVLVFLLFQRTSGPGEVLNDFYTAASEGDCEAAQEELTPQLQGRIPADQLCPMLEQAGLVPDFEIVELTLTGDPGSAANVIISGGSTVGDPDAESAWAFQLVEDEWRIDGLCRSSNPSLVPLLDASEGEDSCPPPPATP